MARTTITTEGAINYRTKNLPLSIAANFARCISANSSRFCDVAIVAAKTKQELFSVQFRPVSTVKQGDLYEAQWNVRKERGETEGAEYLFWKDSDRPAVTWCFNPLSGETYEVTPFNCSCPDYHYRASKAGLPCKHMFALQAQADAGTLGKTDKVSPRTPEQRADLDRKIRSQINSDF